MRALSLLCLLFLTACLNRPDSLAPVITITDPPSGAVRSAENLAVSGYALDDEGIEAIRVNGFDLLEHRLYQTERGKRLIQFSFGAQAVSEGQRHFAIEVEDTSGRVSTLYYELQIDATPPEITLEAVEAVANNQLRVSGLARDNDMVARIIINDIEMPFSPAEERPFSLTIPQASAVQVIAEDRAGNRAVLEREVP